MDREDFETSTARAKSARSSMHVQGAVVYDFKWMTRTDAGRMRWHWVPLIEEHVYGVWNPDGGPAILAYHWKAYWLCLGWSRMEPIEEHDPRAQLRESNHGGA